PAGLPQLPHAGVDDGDAGASRLPRVEGRRIEPSPGEIIETHIEVALGRMREVMQQVVRELAPAELALECGSRFDGRIARTDRGEHALHRDFAEVQVRRE